MWGGDEHTVYINIIDTASRGKSNVPLCTKIC
jgi:hypothetical protein